MFQNNLISKPAEQDHSILSKGDEKMNAKNVVRFLSTAILFAFLLTACGAQKAPAATPSCPPFDSQTGWPLASQSDDGGCNYAPPAGNPTSTLPAPAIQQPAGTGSTGSAVTPTGFTPNWTGLSNTCPNRDEFLRVHNLTDSQVIFHPAPSVSWEPCQQVIELREEFYGKVTIPLINGWAYTLAPVNGDVTDMWGGDSAVPNATIQWGFTARWAPAYQSLAYPWLQANNPCEWLVRDWRFGRYWRLPNLGIVPPEVPYYDRVGPYTTLPGNVSCTGWVPPSVDQTVPNDYLQATAMLGGLANANEWQHSGDNLNWAWKYSAKVAGSGDYCPSGMPCWQTTYLPSNSRGYIELWANGGPQKYYAAQIADLMLGNLNVDEFTYHSNPNH